MVAEPSQRGIVPLEDGQDRKAKASKVIEEEASAKTGAAFPCRMQYRPAIH